MKKNDLKVAFSLDFELLWGLIHRIKSPTDKYLTNIRNVPLVISSLIDFFDTRSIPVLWAFVDAIHYRNSCDIYNFLDKYNLLEKFQSCSLNLSSLESRFGTELFYAPDLITKLIKSKFGVLGCHSFSHALFDKNNIKSLQATLLDIEISSLHRKVNSLPINTYIFPQNTYCNHHLVELRKQGFKAYRGVENLISFSKPSSKSLTNRAFRFLDCFFPIFEPVSIQPYNSELNIFNVPGSMFLRPVWSNSSLRKLSLHRVLRHIDYCYEKGITVHFWWHPHNFGYHLDDNLENLNYIYNYMANKYSLTFVDFSYN